MSRIFVRTKHDRKPRITPFTRPMPHYGNMPYQSANIVYKSNSKQSSYNPFDTFLATNTPTFSQTINEKEPYSFRVSAENCHVSHIPTSSRQATSSSKADLLVGHGEAPTTNLPGSEEDRRIKELMNHPKIKIKSIKLNEEIKPAKKPPAKKQAAKKKPSATEISGDGPKVKKSRKKYDLLFA